MTHVFYSAAATDASVGGELLLDGDEGHHAVKVRRITVGEQVEVVDGRGTRACGSVSEVRKDSCTVSVESIEHEPVASPAVTVVQALTKKDRSDQAIELLTEVGVDVVLPWRAQRSVTSEVPAKWARIVVESCKQSRRARFPRVHDLAVTDAVVAFLNEQKSAGAQVLVCHESATVPMSQVLQTAASAYVIVIGPEGGLTDDELQAFTGAGADVVKLGPSVLRAATAGAVAASIVSALSTRWSATKE